MTIQETIDGLAKDLNATIEYTADRTAAGEEGPSSNTEQRKVWTAPLNEGTDNERCQSFWATLHELGHIAHGHHGLRNGLEDIFGNDPRVAEQEAEAWVWAIDHAGRPLNEVAKTDIQFSLTSYLVSTFEPNIGPSLKRVFREVGGNAVEQKLFLSLFPHDVPYFIVQDVWSHYAKIAA